MGDRAVDDASASNSAIVEAATGPEGGFAPARAGVARRRPLNSKRFAQYQSHKDLDDHFPSLADEAGMIAAMRLNPAASRLLIAYHAVLSERGKLLQAGGYDRLIPMLED